MTLYVILGVVVILVVAFVAVFFKKDKKPPVTSPPSPTSTIVQPINCCSGNQNSNGTYCEELPKVACGTQHCCEWVGIICRCTCPQC